MPKNSESVSGRASSVNARLTTERSDDLRIATLCASWVACPAEIDLIPLPYSYSRALAWFTPSLSVASGAALSLISHPLE